MTNYRDSRGQPILLTKKIASSGEGEVWQTSRSGYLAKIYKKQTPERIKKLEVMVAHPPNDPTRNQNHISIAWPKELLIDSSGVCLGFLMPAITQAKDLLSVYNPLLRQKNGASRFNWQYLHITAQNLASIVQALHDMNYVIGDMKSQNVLVNEQGLVSIIDTDSFQITNPNTGSIHRCPVGSEGFTPPELLGKDISQVTQNKSHDRFRLGVIIHLLLFGYDPFARGIWSGSGNPPESDVRVRQNLWIYAPNSQFKPDPSTIPLEVVHPEIKKLFLKCFNDGHQNPSLRPSAEDWVKAVKLASSELTKCNKVGNHVYSRTYGKCYWCERASKLGVDIFSVKVSRSSYSPSVHSQQPTTLHKPNPAPNPKTTLPQQPPPSQSGWGFGCGCVALALFLLSTLSWCSSQSLHQSTQTSTKNTSNISSVSSPEKFLEDYYSAINNHEYLSAWNRLSSQFQTKKSVHPTGYNAYLDWWKTVDRVKMNRVTSVSKSNEAAKVDINLQYFMKSGKEVSQSLRFFLVWDTKIDRWVIDDVKHLKG
jgi:serine/threonine protein kinase